MKPIATIVSLFAALTAPALFGATLRGRSVAPDGTVLPGCTVTVGTQTTTSDARGAFALTGVDPGNAVLTVALAGYASKRTRITIAGDLDVGDQMLRIRLEDTRGCAERRPDNPWQPPSCDDLSFDRALSENAEAGDESALSLLEQRFELADSYRHRYRIGIVLMAHHRYTDRVWEAVKEDAELYLRFTGDSDWAWDDIDDWCDERGIDPGSFATTIETAFDAASIDPRSRPLLLKALGSRQRIDQAIAALALHHDETALPDIDAALAKLGEHASSVAYWLYGFNSAAADAVAFKYLTNEMADEYRDARNAASQSRD